MMLCKQVIWLKVEFGFGKCDCFQQCAEFVNTKVENRKPTISSEVEPVKINFKRTIGWRQRAIESTVKRSKEVLWSLESGQLTPIVSDKATLSTCEFVCVCGPWAYVVLISTLWYGWTVLNLQLRPLNRIVGNKFSEQSFQLSSKVSTYGWLIVYHTLPI